MIGLWQYAITLHTFELIGKTTLDIFVDGGLYLKFEIYDFIAHTGMHICNCEMNVIYF